MEIIKISDKSHFDMAVSLLEEGFTETRKSWERLFSAYIPPQGNFGLLAIENGVAVGVILIFISNIKIYQEQAKVVNLSAWYVRKDYRYIALKLITLILKEYGGNDTIFVNLTASKRVQEIFLNLGFITLSEYDQLMPTFIFNPFFNKKITIDIATKKNIHNLTDKDLIKVKDHDPKWFKKIIYRIKNQNYETLIFKKIKRKGIPLLRLIYASSPEDLLVINSQLKFLAFKHKYLFLSFPSSFSYKNIPLCIKDIRSAPILIKSILKVKDIDKIYLEDSFSGLN